MAYSTTQLRQLWAPPCKGPWATISLYGAGRVSVRPAIIAAVEALNACLIQHKYKTRYADTGAYNCRKITNGDGYSLHAYGTALDLNWQTNPYGSRLVTDMPVEMRAAIKAIRTNGGHRVWGWGGDYRGNKDAMHWEVVCSPAQLSTGINPHTVPGWVDEPVWAFPPFPGEMRVHDHSADVASLKLFLIVAGYGSFNRESNWSKFYTEGVANEVRRMCADRDTLMRMAGKPGEVWDTDGRVVGQKIWSYLGWLVAQKVK